MSASRLAFVLVLIPILVSPVLARDWLVRPDGTGDAPTIQAAIDSVGLDDHIVLADGLYSGTGNRDLYNSDKMFSISSASGDPSTCVIDCGSTPGDPHWGFSLAVGG